MNYISCTVLLLLISFVKTNANSLDSLLKTKVPVERPYIILNITSTDCITCRAGSKKIIDGLKITNKDRVYLLTDDRNMSLYFNKHPEIYNRFNIIYDRALSNALALGPSSTVCVVDKGDVQRMLLSKIDADSISYIENKLRNSLKVHSRIILNDSMLNDLSDVTYCNDYVLVYNEQFQSGLYYHFSSKTSRYIQPQYDDTTVELLYGVLRNNGMRNLTDAVFGKQWLMEDGVSPVSAHSINANENSLLFKLYAISIDTIINNNADTVSSANPHIFTLEKAMGNNFDILNMNNHTSITLHPPVINNRDTFNALSSEKHQVYNGNTFLVYWDIRHSKSVSVNGRQVKLPTNVSIIEFDGKEKGVAKPKNIFKVKNDSGTKFFFRIADNGYPVVVNNSSGTIAFLQNDFELKFEVISSSPLEKLSKCFDVSIKNDTIKYVGITKGKKCIKGYYAIKSGKMKTEELGDRIDYDNIRINGSNILACKKNVATNELYLDLYTF
jgi:hypothetical protein